MDCPALLAVDSAKLRIVMERIDGEMVKDVLFRLSADPSAEADTDAVRGDLASGIGIAIARLHDAGGSGLVMRV